MTPFGYMLLLLVLYVFLKNRNIEYTYIKLLTITICIETYINIGYWFSVSNYEFHYSEGLLAILSILSILLLLKSSINKRIFFGGYIFLSILILSIFSLLILPLKVEIITYGMQWYEFFYGNFVYPEFTIQSLKMFLRFFIYVLISITTISIGKHIYIDYIIKRFLDFGRFIIVYIIIEFLIKNILKSNLLNNFNLWFFGLGGSTLTKLLERGNLIALQGLTREPSHLAITLFWYSLIVIITNYYKNNTWRVLLITYILMLSSRSFAAILYILGLSSIYAILNNKKLIYISFALFILPIMFVSNYFRYYMERVINSVNLFSGVNPDITMSEHIRMLSIVENLKIFIQRPIFGIGIGTSYAHGAFPSLISNTGIAGFLLWLYFNLKCVGNIRFKLNEFLFINIFIICWFFTGDIGALYSTPLLLVFLIFRYKSNKHTIQGER